jgi:hypothetical protein
MQFVWAYEGTALFQGSTAAQFVLRAYTVRWYSSVLLAYRGTRTVWAYEGTVRLLKAYGGTVVFKGVRRYSFF